MKTKIFITLFFVIATVMTNSTNSFADNGEGKITREVTAVGGLNRGYSTVNINIADDGVVKIICSGIGNEQCALAMDNGNSDLDILFEVAYTKIKEGQIKGKLSYNDNTVVWRAIDDNNFQIWNLKN